jgi:hypothetical protein
MLEEIVRTRAEMKRMGFATSTYPHYVDVANVSVVDQVRMKKLGIFVRDRTNMSDFFRGIWHPVKRLEDAQEKGQMLLGRSAVPLLVQNRKDGWATYFKFLAWKLLACKKVLAFDADVHFIEKYKKHGVEIKNHGREIEKDILSGPADEFSAFEEIKKRGYCGLNVCAMILSPSQETYDLLIRTANQSSSDRIVVPFTNCEQDVIESLVNLGKFKLTSERVRHLPLIHRKMSMSFRQFSKADDDAAMVSTATIVGQLESSAAMVDNASEVRQLKATNGFSRCLQGARGAQMLHGPESELGWISNRR